jgi:hypothetical protein
MSKHFNDDYDFIPAMGTEARSEEYAPKAAKGGVFAPADMKVIKEALEYYIHNSTSFNISEERHITNLLHRLNRIS